MQYFILEQALNYLIEHGNSDVTPLEGKTVHFCLQDFSLDAYFICTNRRIFVLSSGDQSDVDITLSAAVFRSLFKGETLTQLLKDDKIIIHGDVKTAQLLVDFLQQTEIDLEEVLSQYTGDIVAHQVGTITKKLKNTKHSMTTAKDRLTNFLINPNVVR